MRDKVTAYAGSTYPESPRSIEWEGQSYRVQAVLARWREPHRLGFLVRCTPGKTLFELFYLIEEDQWQIRVTGSVIDEETPTKSQA
jgi:hypothetical protein